MIKFISVEQPIRFVYCSLRKFEAIYIPLRYTVDIFGAKGEANTDFITCNNLVAAYFVRIMGCIRSCILKRITIDDNHCEHAIHVLQNPERSVLKVVNDRVETILGHECKINSVVFVIDTTN